MLIAGSGSLRASAIEPIEICLALVVIIRHKQRVPVQ